MNQVPTELREKIETGRIIGFPDKERLKQEVYAWRNEAYRDTSGGMSRMMGDSSGLIQEAVTIENIDWFTWEVWGEIDASSPISDAIDLQMGRNHFTKVLKIVSEKKSREEDGIYKLG